jgi:hypothetical protein
MRSFHSIGSLRCSLSLQLAISGHPSMALTHHTSYDTITATHTLPSLYQVGFSTVLNAHDVIEFSEHGLLILLHLQLPPISATIVPPYPR